MTQVPLKAGMKRDEVAALLGEPDDIAYLKVSFRPPADSEDPETYQREREQWERTTPGEIWSFDKPALSLRVSKSGRLISWNEEESETHS